MPFRMVVNCKAKRLWRGGRNLDNSVSPPCLVLPVNRHHNPKSTIIMLCKPNEVKPRNRSTNDSSRLAKQQFQLAAMSTSTRRG